MNILFIHGNYPAQFRYLAPLLGKDTNHRVIYLTNRKDAKNERLEGVEIENIESHRAVKEGIHHYLISAEESVLQGQSTIRSIIKLIENGFVPDMVIYHAGMGFGLFTKDLLPRAIHIGYFEWYFTNATTQYLVKELDFDTQLKSGMRNIPILKELECCDFGVIPTEWQRGQFPKEFQEKLKVIFDGIDESFFHPNKDKDSIKRDITIKNREDGEEYVMKKDTKVLTYATRGMEPLSGFPEFMETLPALLSKIERLEVFIAGLDRRAYSYDAPIKGGSWKEYMIKKLGDKMDLDKVKFTGLLDYKDYRLLLWRSDLHCYFTRPYVTSWSLFEAGTCGAKLALNKTKAVEGIIEENTALWVDIDNKETMIKQMENQLRAKEPVRSRIKTGYGLQDSMAKWEEFLNECIKEKRSM